MPVDTWPVFGPSTGWTWSRPAWRRPIGPTGRPSTNATAPSWPEPKKNLNHKEQSVRRNSAQDVRGQVRPLVVGGAFVVQGLAQVASAADRRRGLVGVPQAVQRPGQLVQPVGRVPLAFETRTQQRRTVVGLEPRTRDQGRDRGLQVRDCNWNSVKPVARISE